MYCPNCGAENDDNVNFCKKCGCPLKHYHDEDEKQNTNSYRKESYDKDAYDEGSYDARSYDERSYDERSYGERSYDENPYEEEDYDERPRRESSDRWDESEIDNPYEDDSDWDEEEERSSGSKLPVILGVTAGAIAAAAVVVVLGVNKGFIHFPGGNSAGQTEASASQTSSDSGEEDDLFALSDSSDEESGKDSNGPSVNTNSDSDETEKKEQSSSGNHQTFDASSSSSSEEDSQEKEDRDSDATPAPLQASPATESSSSSEEGIHRYELVVEDTTWDSAFQEAKDKGGYLVRINSRDEYNAILQQISAENKTNIQFYLGARRDDSSQDYYWVDENNNFIGDPINASGSWCEDEWLSGEPSFTDGSVVEDKVDMFLYQQTGTFVWNDCSGDLLGVLGDSASGKIGYIVEYDT